MAEATRTQAFPDPLELAAFRDFAEYLARIGGQLSLGFFRDAGLKVERKADDSPVTVADRQAEQVIREAIRARYPDHGILGEEYGAAAGSAEWEWIIDPIDGTKSFVRGVGLYTTLVALLYRGEPLVGVIYCPPTGELVSAVSGQGARDAGGRPVTVSGCTRLAEAWLMLTDPSDFLRREPSFSERLLREVEASRTWADGYGYLMLASGRADIMVDPIMSPWDIAALGVVVREAGGVLTDLDGTRQALGSSAIAAATPELHNAVLAVR